MRGLSKAAKPVCAYCGSSSDLTRDHVPPLAVFPDEPKYRRNLITVPSCRRCNKRHARDDEYLAHVLAAHATVVRNPASASFRARIHRGLRRFRSALPSRLARSMRRVNVSTPAGIHLGKLPVLQYERKRLEALIRRFVTGLHLHHFNERLPATHEVTPMVLADRPFRAGANRDAIDEVYDLLKSAPLHDIGEGVFKYRFMRAADDPASSSWIMTFYESMEFAAWIMRIEPGGASATISGTH